jgi:formamidopyrimidine-DNA glycosylase
MPELPDVEIFKQYFDATSLHHEIEKVRVDSKRILKCSSRLMMEKIGGRCAYFCPKCQNR